MLPVSAPSAISNKFEMLVGDETLLPDMMALSEVSTGAKLMSELLLGRGVKGNAEVDCSI